MIKRLILFLIRMRLGLSKFEAFRFANQNSDHDYYYFTSDCILKYTASTQNTRKSNVSINWLLDPNCKIEILDADDLDESWVTY